MVNGVPRQVPRPKPEAAGLPRGTSFTMIHPRLFHIFSFFRHPGLVKWDFFHWRQTQPLPREYLGQYAGHGSPILVGLNSNILVRDVERMVNIFPQEVPWLSTSLGDTFTSIPPWLFHIIYQYGWFLKGTGNRYILISRCR